MQYSKIWLALTVAICSGWYYAYIKTPENTSHNIESLTLSFEHQAQVFGQYSQSILYYFAHKGYKYKGRLQELHAELSMINSVNSDIVSESYEWQTSLSEKHFSSTLNRNILQQKLDSLKILYRASVQILYADLADIIHASVFEKYPQKALLEAIDTAFGLVNTPLFDIKKLSPETFHLSVAMLNCEIKRLFLNICFSYKNLLDIGFLEFDAAYICPDDVFKTVALGDTLESHLRAYYPNNLRISQPYFFIGKDTFLMKNHLIKCSLPTQQVGKNNIKFGISWGTSYDKVTSSSVFEYRVKP